MGDSLTFLRWFTRLGEVVTEPVFLLERDGVVIAGNAAAAYLCNVSPAELVQRRLQEFIASDGTALEAYLRLCARNMQPLPGRLVWKNGGRSRAVRCNGANIIDEATGNRYIFLACRPQHEAVQRFSLLNQKIDALRREVQQRQDVEEELRLLNETLERTVAERSAVAERRSQQLQRLATQLSTLEQRERRRLARMLHDNLQQLIVAAKMRMALLTRQLQGTEASEAVQRVEELLTTSIETSRALAVELSPPVLHDAGLVSGLQWLSRWLEKNHGLRVEVTGEDVTEPDDEGLRMFLFEAVKELLLNVVKHANTTVASVGVEAAHEGRLRITVADEGAGFHPRLGDRSEDEHGFGLFSIQERLEALGGSLVIDSAPGNGARLTLLTPAAENPPISSAIARAAATAPAASTAGTAAGSAVRVLVVDDHRIVRQGLIGLLSEDPNVLVIGEAGDGEEAVRLASRLTPDVIIMDVNMPKLNGIEATERIKRNMPHVTVIGLSLHREDDMAQRMLSAGAARYLSKDGPMEMLLSAISELRPPSTETAPAQR